MQRISTVLNESEVVAVRKAVCVEGVEQIVVTPIPYWMCGVDLVDLYSERKINELEMQVRLDVTAEDSRTGRIISAIQRIVHAGKIILATRHAKISKVHSLS